MHVLCGPEASVVGSTPPTQADVVRPRARIVVAIGPFTDPTSPFLRGHGLRTGPRMLRSPRDVYAHLRAKARLEPTREEGPRPVTLDEKLRWLASDTLRPPAPGHVDVVLLGRRRG
jgi:hypothetical protein